ncbi:hypothetical protein [Mycobacterium sp. NAZ190054]|uniref:hypothetical protein n=1 Tax=Mycobacterium sp. NAZ190054 TaxID=1747766 RepID=UPI0012E3747D|nr:hypothetical protein [Mycobacterium sp. NAZ190054]
MAQVRGKHYVPDQWEVPDYLVRGWGAAKAAAALVRAGLWVRVPGGYRYAWIRKENTPDRLRALRKRERDKWDSKQARKRFADFPNSPGELYSTPPGEV